MSATIIPLRPPAKTVSGIPLGRASSETLESFPVAMQSSPDVVHVLVGNEANGIELAISPAEARAWGDELKRCADAAETAR